MVRIFRLIRIRWPAVLIAAGVALITAGCSGEPAFEPPPLPPGEFAALKKQSKSQAEFRNAIKRKLSEGSGQEPLPPDPTARTASKKKRG
jgi:hypothetical protein